MTTPAQTTLQLGWTDPRTGVFGAHPVLGGPLNLNDGATYTLISPDGLEVSPPRKTIIPTGNIRSQGERVVRAVYRENREAIARFILGPMASDAAMKVAIRNLVSWLDASLTSPLTIKWQPPSAANPVYLDVTAAVHSIPANEKDWVKLQLEPVELAFYARPTLRGDRVWLQNLVMNPGFEAPSGPGAVVFADGFSGANSLNNYTTQAGSTPTIGTTPQTFVDNLMAQCGAALVRYYRLGEASGTSAYDIGGSGQAGTTHGSPTQGVAGLLTGDTDTCYTLAAASSQYISTPATGIPTGNNPITIGCWMKFAANPAANQVLVAYGATTSSTHNIFQIFLNTTGHVVADNGGGGAGTVVSSGALMTGVAHLVVATWDGTTMTIWVDGASAGTATPGNQTIPTSSTTFNIGATTAGAAFFSGQVDEVIVTNTALSGTVITNIYNAGHTGATGTISNVMTMVSGARISFGSPNWSAVNMWQMRLRWINGLTVTAYLHYTNANNYLAAVLSPSGLVIHHVIGGVDTTLLSSANLPTHEMWYWLQVTQFPTVAGNPSLFQAQLLWDDGGAPASVAMSVQAATADAVTALSGQPQLLASGASLAIGGVGSSQGQQVSLFGPGGWIVQGITTGAAPTAQVLGAWDQTPANTYPGGPVVSVAAGRLDLPPAGTVDGCLRLYAGGSPMGALGAIPVTAATDALQVSAWVKSSGLNANAQLRLVVTEYNAAGTQLRQTTVATLSGNQASWTQMTGNVTTGANCAYADLMLRVVDTTTPGESANGIVWWENCQVWDSTLTGVAAGKMPYCELRFP
jgi:hypothetical protein